MGASGFHASALGAGPAGENGPAVSRGQCVHHGGSLN